MNYASVTKRVIAFVIDYYVMSLLFSLSGLVWHKSMFAFFERIFLCVTYLPFCWYLFKGYTLGNFLMKIKVIKVNGERISILGSIFRTFLLLISGSLAVFSIPMMFLSKRKQAIHDRAAETIVIEF